jgi:hypothetical protein
MKMDDSPHLSSSPNSPLDKLQCPLGKRCRIGPNVFGSTLVKCQLLDGETCKQNYEIGGEKYCWIFLYPTEPRRS